MQLEIEQAADEPVDDETENSPMHVKNKRVREPCSITDRSNQNRLADVIDHLDHRSVGSAHKMAD